MGQRRYYLCPPEVIEVPTFLQVGPAVGDQRAGIVKREARGHAASNLVAEVQFLSSMLRRAQIRIGSRPLSEWLRGENRLEAKRGLPPNRQALRKSTLALRPSTQT